MEPHWAPEIDEVIDGTRWRVWKLWRWWERPRWLWSWLRGYDVIPPTFAVIEPPDA